MDLRYLATSRYYYLYLRLQGQFHLLDTRISVLPTIHSAGLRVDRAGFLLLQLEMRLLFLYEIIDLRYPIIVRK